MRADIVPGAVFPDYELSDHSGKHRKLPALQGQHPMVLVLSRGGFSPRTAASTKGRIESPTFVSSPRKRGSRGCTTCGGTRRRHDACRPLDPRFRRDDNKQAGLIGNRFSHDAGGVAA